MNSKRRAINGWILAILTIIYLFAFIAIKSVYADDCVQILLSNRHRVYAIDIDKPNEPGYNQTCSLAAFANAIMFSQKKTAQDAYLAYLYFVKEMGNKPYGIYDVWDFFMDHSNKPCDSARYNNITSQENKFGNFEYEIMGMIDANWIVLAGLKIPGRDVGHVITVYGYKTCPSENYLLYVDSDDHKTKMWTGLVYSYGNKTYLKMANTGKSYEIEGYWAIKFIGDSN